VACRQMLEEYYRAAAECFAHRKEEALHVAQTWQRLCAPLFGALSAQQCKATKMLLVSLVRCRRHGEALTVAKEYMELAIRAFGPLDVHAAMAMNDVATLTWRRDPRRGLELYQRALEVYRRSPGGAPQVAPTLYNMGLAAMRINTLRQALGYFNRAREAASHAGDRNMVSVCERMNRAVIDIAATKIQRWVRDCMYGIAPSQTSRTDLCSTLSWSDKDEVASTTGDIMHTAAVMHPAGKADEEDEPFGTEHHD
jgi:tetratricopeptide (TPR) repeat protein